MTDTAGQPSCSNPNNTDSDAAQVVAQKWKTLLASAFILFYIYAVGLWLLPSSAVRDQLLSPIKPLIEYFGLWQTFVVFAPNPRNINLDLAARISFQDGSTQIWNYPRLESMGFFERISKERFRKFGYNHLNEDKDAILRPDFARYIARLYDSPTRHPVRVSLVRHWAQIPPPQEGIGKPLPPHLRFQIFQIYQVSQADLL